MNYYPRNWKCPNCGSNNFHQIEKGKTVQEADTKCDHCGCTEKQFWSEKR